MTEKKPKKRKFGDRVLSVFWPMFTRDHYATPKITTGNPQAAPPKSEALAKLRSIFTEEIKLNPRQRFTYVPLPADVSSKLTKLQAEVVGEDGVRQDIDHITLVYVQKSEVDVEQTDVDRIVAILRQIAAVTPPIKAKVQGWAYFDGAGDEDAPKTALVGLIDAPGLPELYVKASEALGKAGLEVSKRHGFTPHVTFCYLEKGGRIDNLPQIEAEFVIDKICFANSKVYEVRLGGVNEDIGTAYQATGGSYFNSVPLSMTRMSGPRIEGPGIEPDREEVIPGDRYDLHGSPGLGFKTQAAWRVWQACLDVMKRHPGMGVSAIIQAATSRANIRPGQVAVEEIRLIEMGIEWYLSSPGSAAADKNRIS